MRVLTLKRVLFGLVLVGVLALAALAQDYRLFQRGWFNLQQAMPFSELASDSLALGSYRAVIQAQPIPGLEDDVSALTFDPDRRSLFTVTNQNSELIELSLDGQVLRRIRLLHFGDPEAVEYISQGVYVITDESRQRLIKVRVDDSTQTLDAEQSQQLTLALGNDGDNKGFEGLAYDRAGERLFVAKERNPVRIYEVLGFPRRDGAGPVINVDITDDQARDAGLFVRDLSSLQFDAATGHLLALSDESRLVVEMDAEGKPLSTLSLLQGQQGLKVSVPQAEGLTMDDKGTLYLISEPNLFYVFEKPVEG
ncbi:MAG: SdiA-regulated domain-containing protein [Gammaproteobacteria bacterium]|nr:SdiA-regulated domain-containing protein [Gammaproteobacteria bacterium]MBU1491510.1 SdiA-regulated domain-containing protein [Gammaproteobacteria bacterium]MBU2064554.1 SdiA-regulated domain-containing protein [Gammaproteobacteria bacterium]MBU2140037.1 SdiA-regulated domain-containing protein [Gammaproteobacteria bacterium]MBU2216792.1 SdiA-regulated domain-containing protein [Gammaproteobacteria bacterium]